jgi:hypothetical protein
MKSLLKHHLTQIIAYHVESATLEDGIYKLISALEQGLSEDPANVVEVLTEVLNQGSEAFDAPDPNPTQEGKPRCITQYFQLLHY